MNKVVCNLCGTSYPENVAQCPICGYARSAEPASSASDKNTYTYVKGGRFSKANVKKRNRAAGLAMDVSSKKNSKKSKSNSGLLILVIVLLLAIVAVLGYIALRFFVPNSFLFKGFDTPGSSQISEEENPADDIKTDVTPETEATEPDLSCRSVTLSATDLQFNEIGGVLELNVTVDPENTTDAITFASSDTDVATVSDDGLVTAVGEGSALITVTCGTVSAECTVVCSIPTEAEEPAIALNRKEVTFTAEGESWLLYDGDIPVEDIEWSSEDDAIAYIENGKAVAVNNGDTVVYATYNGESVSCIIHCNLDGEGESESGSISEAGDSAKKTCRLYNPTGYADDVTLRIGEKFTLKLVDENTEQIQNAEWKIEDEKVCSYENDIVKALKSGTTEITATYDGVTYTCLIRVVDE